jgi:hypothetical protein
MQRLRRFRVAALDAFLVLAAAQAPLSGQTFLSAMAGYIHHVEGDVFLNDRPIHPEATDFLHVQDGQRLRTAQGHAEILLIPGSFLRLGANSEIEMISAGLANVRLRVTQGSAIVDLMSVFEKDSIRLLAADCEIHFPKPGLYRVNAGAPAATLLVFRGKAAVDTGGEQREVKGQRELALSEAAAGESEKLDPKQKDALDEWNEARATALAKMIHQPKDAQADGMDPAYREWLEMTLRRPSQVSVSSGGGNQPMGGGGGVGGGRGGAGGGGGQKSGK